MNVSAAVIAVSVVVIALELRHITRTTTPHPAPPVDLWAELDAEPQTGVCATCRQPVTRSMAFCDAACQRAWLEDA